MRLESAARKVMFATLCGVMIACGSSSPHDAATAQPDGGGGTITSGDASPAHAEAAPPDAAAAPAASQRTDASVAGYLFCARLDSAADCFACCASYFPLAPQKLLTAAASCTCAAPYCAPLSSAVGPSVDGGDDSGAADARSGTWDGSPDVGTEEPFGQGVCGADMCSSQAAPSQPCTSCVLGVLEGSDGPPPCPDSTAACNADPDCAPLLTCAVNCPGAIPD